MSYVFFNWLIGFFRWLTGRSLPSSRPPPNALSQADPWPLDAPLVQLPPGNMISNRDALSGGIHVFGGTGSGKSSGVIQTLVRSMMVQGWGMLFLSVKSTDAENYILYARDAGREKHVIRITPSGTWRYNWLAAELARPGGSIESVVHLLTSVLMEIVKGKQTDTSSDHSYWADAAKVLLTHALSILAVAESVHLDSLSRLIVSAPVSLAQVQDEAGWQRTSYCARMLAKADKEVRDPMMAREVKIAIRYFLEEFASLSDRTRSSILSTLTTSIDTMMHGVLWHLFAPKQSTFTPEMITRGALVIVDIPMVEHGEVSRIAGMLIKHMTQLALLRRQNPDRPCAIVVDESAFYVSPMDWQFTSLSRASRAMSLYATQSMQNYHARLGVHSDSAVKALLANFQTHILCRNNDTYTNNWAADVISKRWSSKTGSSAQHSMNGASHGSSTNQFLEHPVLPADFLNLRSGSAANNYCVDTIMIGARPWANGEVYLPVTFSQR